MARLWGSRELWTKQGVSFAKVAQRMSEKLALRAVRSGFDLIDAEMISTHAVSLAFNMHRLLRTAEGRGKGKKRRRRG